VDVGIQKNNTEKLRSGWETIKKNIKRIGDLTQDLLTYSKQREPEMENCSPNEIILELMELLKDFTASKNIHMIKDLNAGIGEVLADPKTIHHALLNIINNAIDACIEDENISKKHEVKVKTYIDKTQMLCFEVTDNGCGMDEETRKKLFTPMFSSKGGKGTGLGLLVTGKLIEEHKGTIEIETSPGVGSIFRVRLPYTKVKSVDGN